MGGISCFWSIFENHSWKWLIDFTCTLLFLWGAWEALRNNESFLEKLLWTVIIGSAFNEFLGIFLRFIGQNTDSFAPDRVPGWGVFYPIVFAGDLAGLSILSLIFLRYRNNLFLRTHKVLAFALFALNLLFLFLTGCRMACLALCCASLLALGFWRKKRLLLCLGVPLLAIAFVAKPLLPFLGRGDSGHVEIWRKGFAGCFLHPWIGEGVRLQMKIANGQGGFFPHPHSFFIALFWQAGGIGFFLFFLSLISLFFIGLRKAGNEVGMCFVVYALLCGATDLSFVFKGPSEEWILIWLPFLLSAGFVSAKNQEFRLKTRDV
ncbi:hypothetical protein FAI40_08465 [Acetobacteraceae bacterium]|nr:hypothetical protein FAI40_08465 [Acetobacteraceae bacterium]